MFIDRNYAGRELAEKLQSYRDKDVVVVAIPRGGLPIGAIIAKELNAPLDVAITKKIGHPTNPEFAVGALNKEGYILNPEVTVSREYLTEEIGKLKELVQKKHDWYYSKARPHDLRDKWVILVDDGIATGSTILATIDLIAKQQPKGIVVATPVAPPATIQKLKNSISVNEVVCLLQPEDFGGVGQFYENFYPVSDEDAISILEKVNDPLNNKGL